MLKIIILLEKFIFKRLEISDCEINIFGDSDDKKLLES